MALNTSGLKTHIWNNGLKAALFFLIYPIIITPVYILSASIIWLGLAMEIKHFATSVPLIPLLQMLAVTYWYIPYFLLAGYLLILVLWGQRRLNIGYKFKLITRETHPATHALLENLCISRGMRMPYFFMQPYTALNAYSYGISADSYSITITSALHEKLSEEELEAVLAHELTHIRNTDTRTLFLLGSAAHMFRLLLSMVNPNAADRMTRRERGEHVPSRNIDDIQSDRVTAVSMLMAILGWVLHLGNLGSIVVYLFISRKREFIADAGAIELTKNPHALISALEKISANGRVPDTNPIKRPLYIHHSGHGGWFSSHPTIEARIEAIKTIARIEAAPPKTNYRPPLNREFNQNEPTVW